MTDQSGLTPKGIDAHLLAGFAARLLAEAGVPEAHARLTADDLIAADLENIPSHGIMLLPMYLVRIKARSVDPASRGTIVSDRGTALVMDAGHGLGQVVALHAVERVSARAKELGLAAIAIRNAFHFGAAGHFARKIAAQGLIGIVMSNTRPLMPAPGGAAPAVGNNPIAISMPTSGPHPVEADMAMSASAMGRIRIAAAAGDPIPEGWAVDKEGNPTKDPAAAITGMLLPAAGPKGFGLAFMIDLLCGGLSEGAVGASVKPLYGDPATPYACAQFFLAIDPGHFGDADAFAATVRDQAASISAGKRAPGVERIYAPGELTANASAANNGLCKLDAGTQKALAKLAQDAGLDASFLLT